MILPDWLFYLMLIAVILDAIETIYHFLRWLKKRDKVVQRVNREIEKLEEMLDEVMDFD